MAYITGTITSSDPAAALYAVMAPAFTTAGYTLVDTVVISTRTHKVWKSAAANNTTGLDWYVDVIYQTTGQSNVWLAIYESYDAVNHLGIRGSSANATFVPESTYYSQYGATGATLESANWYFSLAVANPTYNGLQTSVSSFGYWITINPDYIAGISSAVDATDITYVGFINPSAAHVAVAGSTLYPLWGGNLQTGTTTSAIQQTRYPKHTASQAWRTFRPIYQVSSALSVMGSPGIPGGINLGVQQTVIPIPVATTNTSAYSGYPSLAGTLKGVVAGYSNTTTIARGDTFTVGSDTYTCTTYYGTGPYVFAAIKQA